MDQLTKTTGGDTTVMGILAYLGPLVIIPYLTAKDDAFVKFHIKQGLVLLVIEVGLWLLASLLWPFWRFFQIIHIALIVLMVLGIINVVQKKEKELPFVGKFSRYFSF